MNRNVLLMPRLCLCLQKDFQQNVGHSSRLGSEKKWYSTFNERSQGEWDRIAELMMIKFGESGHPVFRATSPLSRGTLKSKGGGKLSIHFCLDQGTIQTVFRTIISVNQLSIYGAVSNLCEECKTCHVRTGRPVLARQPDPLFVPSVMKTHTHTPLTDDPVQEDLLPKYQERVERLSQQNRVIKFCTDAGFLTTVHVRQYFMTEDTEEFSQFTEPVTCREYTLPKNEKLFDPKGWIRGNKKIRPVLEVTTSYLQGKYGVEIRIESENKDNSHSWVRISHGLNKLVTDLSNKEDDNEQETSEMQFEVFALKTNVLASASRLKATAKPRRRDFCQLIHKNYTYWWKDMDRYWTTRSFAHRLPSVKTTEYSSSSWSSTSRRRWCDWILEMKRWSSETFWAISTMVWWRARWQEAGGNKKRFQYCTDSSGQEILYFRALQGHSGRNPIDPSLQDIVLIPNIFYEYIYHIGCAINSHSITNSGLIAGRKFKQGKTDGILTGVTPTNKDHRDPQKKWKRHQDTVFLVDVQLAQRKGLKFYQTRSNAIILHETLPSYCVSKAIVMKSEEIIYHKVYVSPPPPRTISFKDNWMKE